MTMEVINQLVKSSQPKTEDMIHVDVVIAQRTEEVVGGMIGAVSQI